MILTEGLWSRLPLDIIDRVLSFLPVPVLCRFRCVCKRWNILISKPSFHDLCDLNGRKETYLFVTRYLIYSDWCYVDPTFIRTMCFLDLDARRWYSIKADEHRGLYYDLEDDEPPVVYDTRILAMDDGLVCDLTRKYDTLTVLVVSDPIAQMSNHLPALSCPADEALPIIVMAVDSVARTYRVFFVNNRARADTRIFVYESATNKWRGLRNAPERLGVSAALSAVYFREGLYMIFQTDAWNKYVVLSYNMQEDMWREISVSFPDKPSNPQLVVRNNRLFLMVWSFIRSRERGSSSSFEVNEVLVDWNASKRVLQITSAHLQSYFDEEPVDIAYGIPCVDSNGLCSSIILVSNVSGKVIIYNVVNDVVDVLPAHPLGEASLLMEEVDFDGLPVYETYAGKHMNLSLRDVLSQALFT